MDQPYFKATFPIFRGSSLLLMHLWGWGCVVYAFRKTRVNYVFILEADPKSHMRCVLRAACCLCVVYLEPVLLRVTLHSLHGS